MARLNDLPGPTESLEALKRRFVRQNREIARVNSLQSLRIQALETELSHLLKENAALKEQVISLTQDAEKFAAGRAFHKDIDQCKEKLATKVSELNSLVSELGLIPERFLKNTAHLGAADNTSIANQPFPDSNRRPVAWDENGDKLPTILEDKYYPRRTLDTEELTATRQDLDSPTIGSPPIAHFDVDQSPLPLTRHENASSPDLEDNIHSSNNDNNNNDSLPNSPSGINEDVSITEQPVSPSTTALSGSKRKFSATEDEITFSPLPTKADSTLDDGFQFTRAVDVSRALQRPSAAVEVINESPGHGKKQQKRGNLSKRRALEPKSTNMASSPKKSHGTPVHQVGDDKVENISKVRGEEENMRQTEPLKKVSKLQPDQAKKTKRATTATTREDEALKRVISNSRDSMEKGPQRKQSFDERDTNEPVMAESTPLPSLTSRPSRRARGAISYAEPNLRDKMRRATNEMVDAVAIANAQRGSSLAGNSGQDYEPESHNGSLSDRNGEIAITPPIQQDGHGIVAELPKHMVTERKRRTLSASMNEITRLSKAECESGFGQNADADGTGALESLPTTNATKEYPRRRSANLNPQSRRHSSNPAVYDRGKSIQSDKLSNYETLEIGSEYHENDSILEAPRPHKSVTGKDIGTASAARGRGTRHLMEESNVQPTRSQRGSSRRRSTLI